MDALPISFRCDFAGGETSVEACYGPSLGDALARAADLVLDDPESAGDKFTFHDCIGRVLLQCTGEDLQTFAARIRDRGHGGGAPHTGPAANN